jgi:hypothetical protein
MTKENDKKFGIAEYVSITSWKVCGVTKSTVPRTKMEGKTRVMNGVLESNGRTNIHALK